MNPKPGKNTKINELKEMKDFSNIIELSLKIQDDNDINKLKVNNMMLITLLMKYQSIFKENNDLKRQLDDKQDIIDRILKSQDQEVITFQNEKKKLVKEIEELKSKNKNNKEIIEE